MKKIKIIFFSLAILQMLFAYAPAFAQTAQNSGNLPQYNSGVDAQIKQYLCTDQVTLFDCINKIYKFAIVIAATIGVFFIVLAGYLYIGSAGNNEQVEKAKNMVQSTIAALIILLAGFVFLKAINPDLVILRNPSLPTVNIPVTPMPSTVSGNICQAPSNLSCSSATCNSYDSQIAAAAAKISINGVNSAALIKAIMVNESSCVPNKVSNSNPPSYGLMQLQVSTANQFKSACGVSDSIDGAWLTNPANSAQVICIGAQYLQSLASSCNGPLNIAAGYNGGAKACAQSADCTGTSCDGASTMRAWECTFDDPKHETPNTGYNESRNYAPKVLGCYQQFSVR